jgi:8-oxo-dGTP diphosphatase
MGVKIRNKLVAIRLLPPNQEDRTGNPVGCLFTEAGCVKKNSCANFCSTPATVDRVAFSVLFRLLPNVNPIPVTCVILLHEGKVMAAQRAAHMDLPGSWEFPGGKIEEGESPETCLIREVREELAIEIRITGSLTPVTHTYPTKTIRLQPFLASWVSGAVQLSEHSQIRWLGREQLLSVDWAPADLPIVHELLANWVNLVPTS